MCLALFTYHAMRMRHIVIHELFDSTVFFFRYLTKETSFEKKKYRY